MTTNTLIRSSRVINATPFYFGWLIVLAGTIGIVMMGRLLDRFAPPPLLTLALGFLVAALVIVQTMTTPVGGILYGVLAGLGSGSFRVLDAVVWAHYFGRKHLGSIRGITMFGTLGGTALGAYPLGLSKDHWGSYAPVLDALLVLTVLIAAVALFVKKPLKAMSDE